MENSVQHNGTSQSCPVCNAQSDELTVSSIGSTRDRAIMHIACEKCQHKVMAYSAESEAGMVTFGMMTDMHAHEALDMMQQKAIDSDDVIAAYRYFHEEYERCAQEPGI